MGLSCTHQHAVPSNLQSMGEPTTDSTPAMWPAFNTPLAMFMDDQHATAHKNPTPAVWVCVVVRPEQPWYGEHIHFISKPCTNHKIKMYDVHPQPRGKGSSSNLTFDLREKQFNNACT